LFENHFCSARRVGAVQGEGNVRATQRHWGKPTGWRDAGAHLLCIALNEAA